MKIASYALVLAAAILSSPSYAKSEGDYQTWHLPEEAMLRLGKGGIGRGDRVLSFSGDGRLLAVASSIGVWLYEIDTGHALKLLPSTAPVYSVAFSPKGILATGLANGQVELWEAETDTPILTLGSEQRHDYNPVASVAFSPDGTILATGSRNQSVKIWDLKTGRQVVLWEDKEGIGGSDTMGLVAFSPDGTRLALGFDDGGVGLWDVATQTQVAFLKGHVEAVTSVSFSSDSATLASGSWDGTVKLWDVKTQQLLDSFDGSYAGTSVSFSPDGGTLIAGGRDGLIRIWDARTRQVLDILEGYADEDGILWLSDRSGILSVAFSPNSTIFASGAADGTVLLWQEKRAIEFSKHNPAYGIRSVSFSPDGSMIASGSTHGTQLWDVSTEMQIAALAGPTFGVRSVAFSPDGTLIASGGWDGIEGAESGIGVDYDIMLWDVHTQRLLGSIDAHDVSSVSFSPDGTLIVSGSDGGMIILWDVATQRQVAAWEGDVDEGSHSVVFSPDGSMLASAHSYSYRIKLWDVGTRQLLDTLKGHTGAVYSVAFSPDGTTLASVGGRDGVILWDVKTRERITTLKGHTGWLFSVAFSPDGTELAAGSWGWDRTVTVWDVKTQEPIVTLVGHTDRVSSVSYSPDGNTLATGSKDGTILLWGRNPSFISVDYTAFGKITSNRLEGPQLYQNIPNPFNSQTILSYFLPKPGSVSIEVFTLTGQRVRVFRQGSQNAGLHRLRWDSRDDAGRPLASGTYLYRLVTGEDVLTRKLTLLR